MRSTSPRAGKVLALLTGFVVVAVAAGVLAAGLLMPGVGASGSLARNSVAFFENLPTELKQPPLSEQSTLLASDGSVLAHFYEENRTEVPLSKVSPVMRQAIVAIEDSRFYQHGGIDPRGVMRAAVQNQLTDDVQGASTLTQQLVKNILLEQAVAAGDEDKARAAVVKTKARKLQEMKYAISLEKQYDKKQILERYLNIAFFGDKAYGVQAASRYYFNRNANKLTLPQAATLAGIVQAPGAYSPRRNPKDATSRRNVVLGRMLQLGMIDQAKYQKAVDTKLTIQLRRPANGCVNAPSNMGFFCAYVRSVIEQDPAFRALGKTAKQREESLYRGGLTIKTTINKKLQAAATKVVMRRVPRKDASRLGVSAVTIEPGTGKILAMAQNRTYNPKEKRGQTAVNYGTDSTHGSSGGFQPGSTFKAFTLATWLSKGKSLNSTVSADTRTYGDGGFRICGAPWQTSKPYRPTNAGGESSSGGTRTVLEASYMSINTAYMSMASQLDLCDITRTAEKLGVHLAKPNIGCQKGEDASTRLPNCYPSMVLGALEVAPMTMANAFASFGNGGEYCTPIAVTSIRDRNGKGVKIPESKCSQGVSPEVANGVNYALSRVLTSGTARGQGIGRPAAGKTGTTNDSSDTWFVGYTPQRSTAVWVADPGRTVDGEQKRRRLSNITVGGQYFGTMFGASLAAPIWNDIMTTAHKGLPVRGFGSPPSKMLVGEKKGVPDVAGKRVGDAQQILQQAGFKAQVNLRPVRSKERRGTVAGTSPGAGTSLARGSTVEILISAGRAGRGRPTIPFPIFPPGAGDDD